MKTVDIVIVNWNAGAQLRDCLLAVAASQRTGYDFDRVVVVDNASWDGSLEELDELDRLDVPLVILRNDTNKGFAAACNQGAAGSTADYLLFLNPDTRVNPETITASIRVMEAPDHAQTGLLGTQLIDADGDVSRTCARFPQPWHFIQRMAGLDRLALEVFPGYIMGEWDHAQSRYVDHVMGAFFLTRRPLFEQLEGFDAERYFVYLEDVDYAKRVHEAGWRTYYFAGAQVYHKGCGTSDKVKGKRLFYMLQSQIRYAFRYFRKPEAAAHLIGILTLEFAARTARALTRREPAELRATWEAYDLLIRSMPELLKPGGQDGQSANVHATQPAETHHA